MDEVEIEIRTVTNREGNTPLFTAEKKVITGTALAWLNMFIESDSDEPRKQFERAISREVMDLMQRAVNFAKQDKSYEDFIAEGLMTTDGELTDAGRAWYSSKQDA